MNIAPGWDIAPESKGDWLIVRVASHGVSADSTPPLAQTVCELADQRRATRVLLELADVGVLYSYLIGQLVLLQKRVCSRGGLLRLCGLSERNRQALHICRLDDHLPSFANRDEALAG